MRYTIEKHTQRYAGKNLDQSDKFNMEYKCKLLEEAVVGAEQKVTKFFQTPVEIDEARTMSRALLNHRVQELRNLHGQEWILATDGSFDSKTNDPAGWGLFVLSSSGICWLFSGATETNTNMEGWHGEEDHTNNTGEMKVVLAAHVFIQHLQDIAGWQEARHEAPRSTVTGCTEGDDSRSGVAQFSSEF